MKIFAITGAKGGIGKTTLAANLAVCLSKKNKKTLIFDADLGLANIDILFGLKNKKNISNVISGKKHLSEVCQIGPQGVYVIPGSSGIVELTNLDRLESSQLIQTFSDLCKDFDYMFVDLATGISDQTIQFTNAAQGIIIILCNDPSSFADSYALIKILHKKYKRKSFGVVVNKVQSERESCDVFSRFSKLTDKFLDIKLNYIGFMPNDSYVQKSANECKSVVDAYPASYAAQALDQLTKNVEIWSKTERHIYGGIQYCAHLAYKEELCE